MRVLIDADVTVHAVCNQAERGNPEGEPLAHVLHSIKLQAIKWITDAGGDVDDPATWELYLSGPAVTNFRYEVDPEYKGQRPPKPRWFKESRDYLYAQWGAEITDGEADDTLANVLWMDYKQAKQEATYWGEPIQDWLETVLVSVDKDLDMVPGWHFNPRKGEKYWVDENTGWYNFFKQMLTGDTVDNIKGLRSVGPVKAAKVLDTVMVSSIQAPGEYATELYHQVLHAYAQTQVKGEFVAEYTDIFQAADLLWMVRDGRRGHQVLLDLLPGHVAKAIFDKERNEV